jgi:hypothetical protein
MAAIMDGYFKNTIVINHAYFRDVTNETCNADHVMSYEEAYLYSLGYRPSIQIKWSEKKNENS